MSSSARGGLIVAVFGSMLLYAGKGYAIDSYRYLHVSIETPWMIFIFLLVAVFTPFLLMLGLMWWHPKRSISRPRPKITDDE